MTETIVERLRERGRPTFSVEYFPPKDAAGIAQLRDTIVHLGELTPDWVSVTYGATGSSRERTFEAVESVHELGNPRTVGHLTLAGQSLDELRAAITSYGRLGVDHILALRGDPPGGGAFEPRPDGLRTATELVRLIKEMGDFHVGVAAFPDGHPEGTPELDAQILVDKERAGAEFAVTQFFWSVDAYVALVERFRALGGTMPIIAGVMPITAPAQLARFAELSGVPVPDAFAQPLAAVADDKEAFRAVALDLVTGLCEALLDAGAPGLQFFTLNRSTATRALLARLQDRRHRP